MSIFALFLWSQSTLEIVYHTHCCINAILSHKSVNYCAKYYQSNALQDVYLFLYLAVFLIVEFKQVRQLG